MDRRRSMMEHGRYVKNCPSCGQKDVTVMMCRCGKVICRGCSIDGKCPDCYMKENRTAENSRYFNEKYHDGVMIE
jgi:hypothetical protein